MTSPEPLKLVLFGGCRLYDGERERPVPGAKARALLVYLCCNRHPASRQHLATLLWGSRFEDQARQSLRQTLTKLRKALGRDALVTEGDSVAISESASTTDVAAFEEAVARAAQREALALYSGELAAGLAVAEQAFSDWLEAERGRFRRLAARCLHGLAEAALAGDPQEAADFAREAVDLDELDEAAHCLLLKALVASNQRGEAIRHFDRLERYFRDEVQADLDPRTCELGLAVRAAKDVSAGFTTAAASTRSSSPAAEKTELQAAVDPSLPQRFVFDDEVTTRLELPDGPSIAVLPFENMSDDPEQEFCADGIDSRDPVPLALPDKPSVAVLPFINISGDSEQEYFSDGITEDIIIELSRFRSLFVIARHSSFHYKGQSPKVQEIGQELGVRYVVEGSVRKAGNRVRVTTQLVEARSGNHLWAERYDRDLEDIFAVQDELVQTIVSTIGGRIDVAGKARAGRLNDKSLRAYDLYLRAGAAQDRNKRENYRLARQYLEHAVALDPTLAQAYHNLSLVHFMEWMAHWVDDREKALSSSIDAAKRAVELDPSDSSVHSQLGMLHLFCREFDEAGQHFDKAMRLNPNDSRAFALYGIYLTAIGEPDRGIEQFDQAIRLNPLEPSWFNWLRGIAYFTLGRYEDAILGFRSINSPFNEVRGWLAASYAQAGRLDEARAMLEEFLQIAEQEMAVFPGRKLSAWTAYWHGAIEYKNEAQFEHLYDGLLRAGLKE